MKTKNITILFFITFLIFSQNIFSQSAINELSPKMKTMLEMAKGKSPVQDNPLYKTTSTASLLDSAVTYGPEGQMIKYFYTYNSDGYLLSQYDAALTDGGWLNNMLMTYEYDSDNNIISGSGSMWSDGEWIEIMKANSTYSGGIITEEKTEMLMGDTWIVIENSTFTYDASTRTLVEISSGSFSSYTERITEVFNASGDLISTLQESESDGVWSKIEFTEYTYNSNGQETEEIGQIWDGDYWVNSTRYLSTYNENNNRTEELFQYWYEGEWLNSQKNEISFYDNNYMKEYLSSYWSDTDWVEYWKYSYEYSSDGSTFHGTSLANETGTWELYPGEFHFFGSKGYFRDDSFAYILDASEIDAYFSVITDVKDEAENTLPTDYVLEQNYPNPFNPTTVISYTIGTGQLAANSEVQLTVFDMLGKEVATLVNEQKSAGNYTVEFNCSSASGGQGLTSGIYFYRLTAGNTAITKKMLLLR